MASGYGTTGYLGGGRTWSLPLSEGRSKEAYKARRLTWRLLQALGLSIK